MRPAFRTGGTIPRLSRLLTPCLFPVALAATLSACFGDRRADAGEPTKTEHAAFKAPADSSLSPSQVDRYLRTAAAQFEILRAEAPTARERIASARQARDAAPAPKGARPKSSRAMWGDFVDAAFVRAARKLGYNPAELWYVRDRISAVRSHLLTSGLQVTQDQAAELFRQQAEAMRNVPGSTRADRERLLQAAAQAERQAAPAGPPPRVAQNLATLRRSRGGLSDATWDRIGSVASGVGVSELSDAPLPEVARRLDELRRLHVHAVANREPPPP